MDSCSLRGDASAGKGVRRQHSSPSLKRHVIVKDISLILQIYADRFNSTMEESTVVEKDIKMNAKIKW